MSRGTLLVAVMAAVSLLALLSIVGHNSWGGPSLITFTESNGLNVGDLLVVAIWAGAAVCCWLLWRRPDRD